ncbi:FMN-dependent dehydrogenase [Ampelomyces quisqualis]|uniref:FMN-dependent dehydrogenase n=1 Tax=Ampelomyces quisqualis TaxID=50730 RepID=A0A6A5QVT7_AMPQU|nr:FMN-dependent dehydrogenase [Ampelomyces quisqualis]
MPKLAHPDVELALAKKAEKYGIAHCGCTLLAETASSVQPNSIPFFFQLYVNKDRSASEALLRDGGLIDIPLIILLFKEGDEGVKAESATYAETAINDATATNDTKGRGLGQTLATYIDYIFNWEDTKWLRKATKLKILAKSVQTAGDAVLVMEHCLSGIIISNHGGRNLDTSPLSFPTLVPMRRYHFEVLQYLEVYIDCGIMRGTDAAKALCLGAKAFRISRPFPYSLIYCQEGVEPFIDIIQDELEITMKC